jgi:ferrous-iron efflux pump FieF
MEDNLPLVQAHLVAEQVEQAILRRFRSDVIIHQDPCSVVPKEGKVFELSFVVKSERPAFCV